MSAGFSGNDIVYVPADSADITSLIMGGHLARSG